MEVRYMESPKEEAERRGFTRGAVVMCRDGSVGKIVRRNGGTIFCPYVLVELQSGKRVSRGINALCIVQDDFEVKEKEMKNIQEDKALQLNTEELRLSIKVLLGSLRKSKRSPTTLYENEEFKEIIQAWLLELSQTQTCC